jgi:hypothetical protein
MRIPALRAGARTMKLTRTFGVLALPLPPGVAASLREMPDRIVEAKLGPLK